VFAKLYAMSHVRADRWYKLGRTILYGALEDETPFGTVRRFVEYEDYALRLLDDLEFSTPEAYGVIEITPEREYMITMEFCDDAVEISEAVVTPGIVDQGLELVQRMWGAGLAHRDIKPANLMVQGDRLRLIDVFFVQVRPSPWRQAVDLANMMLVLALRTDAPTVYEHALRYFTPDEIAEAFAAARGVASPTQLRTMVKQDERDLVAEFRGLAPHRDPVRIQRWSFRRVALTAWVVLLGLFATLLIVSNWRVFA
jgi:tRNA A-37 threonylcarbamoyl transferase component Bud32